MPKVENLRQLIQYKKSEKGTFNEITMLLTLSMINKITPSQNSLQTL